MGLFCYVGHIFGDDNHIKLGHEAWIGKALMWHGEDGEGPFALQSCPTAFSKLGECF